MLTSFSTALAVSGFLVGSCTSVCVWESLLLLLVMKLGGVPCAVHALCARCAKSWPFSTTGSSVSSEDWKDVIEWLLQWTGL